MSRWIIPFLLLFVAARPAAAHFVWAVPEASTRSARIIISETLVVDTRVDIGILAGAALQWRDESRRETPLALTRAGHVLTVPLGGPRGIVHGHADLGVRPSGDRAYRLHYYPKTILGSPFGVAVGGAAPIEIVPTGSPGSLRLSVVVGGKPAPDVDVTVLLPDGSQTVVQTGPDGATPTLPGRGRFGAWARHWEQVSGTWRGEAFGHTRHYATLVFDTDAPEAATPAASQTAAARASVTLPEAAASFGAVAADGWLYVYGGHVVATHRYSSEAVSGRFSRIALSDMKTWASLPAGPAVQGMNLAAYDGKIYRVGGMRPLNAPGEPEVLESIADAARFDPATGRWEALPPLPAPRSSHDVIVVGHQLFVVGGWTMKAKAPTEWPSTMEVLDLTAETLAWRSVPQPFTRRAFVAAAFDDKIYVLGGFDERSRVVRGTTVYDVARDAWSEGPALPGGAMNGFGPAAAVAGNRLFVSIDDGSIHRLAASGQSWEQVGRATPRIVHRLAAGADGLLIIGGAAGGSNSDLVERLPLR